MLHVTDYTRIKQNSVFLGGNLIFNSQSESFDRFADLLYRHFQSGYSKFHKMDNLCKLGFLGADILLKDNKLIEKYDPYDIGVILSNRNSSLDTDLKHNRQVQNRPASPAVFVYSLPNIVIGEICIRHGIKGENTFFIENKFDIPGQVKYITRLLKSGVVKACIGGWVELLGDQYDCFLYLVENNLSDHKTPYTAEQINKLYTSPDE